MGQILEINQALANLLDYQKLTIESKKIMIDCDKNIFLKFLPSIIVQ